MTSHDSDFDINQIIADANSLMEAVYRDLDISPRRSRSTAPRNDLSADAERQIAHIEDVIESVDSDLRQEQIPSALRPGERVLVEQPSQDVAGNQAIIDLSNSPSCDDVVEVIILDSPIILSHRRPRRINPQIRLNQTRGRSRSPVDAIVIEEGALGTATSQPVTLASRPAAPQLATAKPTTCNFTKQDNDSTQETSMTCPICMEPYANRQPHATKCGHIYCKICINEAIRITHKCPICKTKLSPKMLIRVFV